MRAANNTSFAELSFDWREYWQGRYQQSPEVFEWYSEYRSLAPLLAQHIGKHERVLHVGMGTSVLHEQMARDGYQHIVNTDFCAEQDAPASCKMDFVAADVRDMRGHFDDDSFDVVLDKGTLDALLCADDDTGNARQMMREVARVLSAGGRYVWCTAGAPAARQQYLDMLQAQSVVVLDVSNGQRDAPTSLHEAVLALQLGSAKQNYLYIAQMPKS